jgi:hypothetical protein
MTEQYEEYEMVNGKVVKVTKTKTVSVDKLNAIVDQIVNDDGGIAAGAKTVKKVKATTATKRTRKRKPFDPSLDILERLRSGEKISPIAKDKATTYHEIWKHAQYLVANETCQLVKGKVIYGSN